MDFVNVNIKNDIIMEVMVKYTNYKSQEFKSLRNKDLNSTIEIFNKFPWQEELDKIKRVKNAISPMIKLVNERGEYMEINGFNNNDILFFNATVKYKKYIWRVIRGIKYNKSEIVELITNFFNTKTSQVIETIKSNRNITTSVFIDFLSYNLFRDRDKIVDINKNLLRNYEYSFKISRLLLNYLPSFLFILILVGFSVFIGWNLLILIIFGLIALPGTVLAINHSICSINKKLYFQKNNDTFVIECKNNKFVHDKCEIRKIEKYFVSEPNFSPWSAFVFWRLTMKDGSALNISNLLINEREFGQQFGTTPLNKGKFFPFMSVVH